MSEDQQWREIPIHQTGIQRVSYEVLEAAGIASLGQLVDFVRDHHGEIMALVEGAPASATAKYLEAVTKSTALINKLHAAAGNLFAEVSPKEFRAKRKPPPR